MRTSVLTVLKQLFIYPYIYNNNTPAHAHMYIPACIVLVVYICYRLWIGHWSCHCVLCVCLYVRVCVFVCVCKYAIILSSIVACMPRIPAKQLSFLPTLITINSITIKYNKTTQSKAYNNNDKHKQHK